MHTASVVPDTRVSSRAQTWDVLAEMLEPTRAKLNIPLFAIQLRKRDEHCKSFRRMRIAREDEQAGDVQSIPV